MPLPPTAPDDIKGREYGEDPSTVDYDKVIAQKKELLHKAFFSFKEDVSYLAFIQEQSLGIHYNKGGDLLDYLNDPSIYKYKDGFIEIVSHPGLGVDINEEFVAEKAREFAANGGDWKNPVWHNYDGTVAEW